MSSSIYTQYPTMTKRKQVSGNVCKQKTEIPYFISIQILCYETRNWAQVHPVSIDYPWDVSTTWLESICGKFYWLEWYIPVYIRSHSWQCMSELKPSNEVEGIVNEKDILLSWEQAQIPVICMRIRRRASKLPLPSILLANMQSLENKIDDLLLRLSY